MELYLHIPFCVRKCAYCDFLSWAADEKTRQEYVNVMIKEIKEYGNIYHDRVKLSTIFVGGGTPSVLTGEQVQHIFGALRQSFQISEDAEITMEINPGTVNDEKLRLWKQAGINRLSIGLQSVNNEELKMLGRIHTYEEFWDTYRAVRVQGFQNVNIDLISAIPGQTLESWKKTLTRVAELEPEHISAYSLIVEEGTPFYGRYKGSSKIMKKTEDFLLSGEGTDRYLPLPDEETERAIYGATGELLEGYGYCRYEISNYAKEGYACRHNLGYWERRDYLGIGLGASSLVDHTRYHNTSDYKKYISGIEEQRDIREEVEALSMSDEMEEFMFLGLRETRGISAAEFKKQFGKKITDVYGKQIRKLESEELLVCAGDRIYLTERGTDISNAVFVLFLDPE